MAKSNKRFFGTKIIKSHCRNREYKIPIKYRKHNIDKWTKDKDKIKEIRLDMNKNR